MPSQGFSEKNKKELIYKILKEWVFSPPTFLFFTVLVVFVIFTPFSYYRFLPYPDKAHVWISEEWFPPHFLSLKDALIRWDSVWYLDIASQGYSFRGEGKLSNIAFFPLYPLLLRAVSVVIPDKILAGLLVSWTFALASLHAFYLLIKRHFNQKIKDPLFPLFLFVVFPTFFFMFLIYTESLFLFFSLMSFYYALSGQWQRASLFLFFAGFTRPTFFFLYPALILEYLWQKRKIDKELLVLLIPPLAPFLYFSYLYLRWGDFLLWFKVEEWWGRSLFVLTKEHFLFNNPMALSNFLFNLFLFVFLLLVIIYGIYRKERPSLILYAFTPIFIVISSGTFMSMSRFALITFPIFLFLAQFLEKRYWLKTGHFLLSSFLLSLLYSLFLHNMWVA